MWQPRRIGVRAAQWNQMGDDPQVKPHPEAGSGKECPDCHRSFDVHGWLNSLYGRGEICPGEYIVRGGLSNVPFPVSEDTWNELFERTN